MKTRKNLWGTLILAMMWTTAVVFIVGTSAGLPQLIAFVAALFVTYQILRILEYIPPVLHKQPPRQRIDRVLDDLSAEEMAVLRRRLMDADADYDDYASFDALLHEIPAKRKAHE